MKTFHHLLITLSSVILIGGFSLPTKAERVLVDTSSIPADQWESHPEVGIDIAIFLVKEKKDNKETYFLKMFLKNKSQKSIEHPVGRDYGFRFFYTDQNAIQHDLHPGDWDIAGMLVSGRIFPGETLMYGLELNTADLTFVTSHPIQCDFSVWDSDSNQRHDIITSPKTYSLPQ